MQKAKGGAGIKKLHNSFASEDGFALGFFRETVNGQVDGWQMTKLLPQTIDQESGEWWGIWEAALKDSDGVLVVKTKAYEQKLAYGLSKKAEAADAPGKGIYREVEAILRQREQKGEEFAVFVLDPDVPMQGHNDLKALLDAQQTKANLDVLEQRFAMSPEVEEVAAPPQTQTQTQTQQQPQPQAEAETETVVGWLMALKIKGADAEKYAVALEEIGVDAPEHMYALEAEDLEEVGMKKVHRRVVMRRVGGE